MSGGSQHPNGRQSQLGAGWSPLQLQMASYLARAPQAHLASERGVTWHTPTPPHLYHVPVPSPPDPLQAMKVSAAAGNSVFRHSATPPELYRHTPTPPDKHLMRHTPSPGDVKAGVSLPAPDIFPHLGSARDKLSRAEDLLYGRGGVDLSCPRGGAGGARAANGSPAALSVRDAPTINSLIARAPPRHRVDSLLERLAPAPASVIVQPRAPPTPSPPSAGDDEENSGGSSKRKRKPERVVRVPAAPPEPRVTPPCDPPRVTPPCDAPRVTPPRAEPRLSPPRDDPLPLENGSPHAPPAAPPPAAAPPAAAPEPAPHARRKTNSTSSETIDDIAAMIASTDKPSEPAPAEPAPAEPPVTIDKLKSVLGSPEPAPPAPAASPPRPEQAEAPPLGPAAAPRRRSARAHTDTLAPVESPSEGRPAEPDQPVPASIVDVEDQLEKMFAGLEPPPDQQRPAHTTPRGRKRRKSTVTKAEKKRRSSEGDGRKKPGRKKAAKQKKNGEAVKEYDSGSNASSGRSRGPYIQIRGPRDSPLSVSVVNAAAGEDEEPRRRHEPDFRNGMRVRGLHCSTLGLRYDAATPDASWVCAFCTRGPHAPARPPLGDLFGPYSVSTDCDEYRALDEAGRARHAPGDVWLHEECAVWAGGVLAAGARVWGLPAAVWGAAGTVCAACGARGAALACSRRACAARAHLPCARDAGWALLRDEYRALCPAHART